ncbi:MAG: ScyD/ScyE family protein, partial [Caldilineaceae bacterium]|nr:ScyD/ScyE family protein [Caldilineaceae bacterium]
MTPSKLGQLVAAVALILGVTTACAPAPSSTPAPGALPDLPAPSVTVVVDGLFGPLGLEALADGSLLVAEEGTGQRDDSAGVSLITPDGTVGRFISGLPSTRDAGDLAGVPLVKLSPDGTTLYVGNFGVGHLWTYTLSADEQAHGIALPAVPLTTDDLGTAMARLNNVMLINPFDMTFDAAGVPVVADASGNGVAKENANGTTRFIHRFDQLPNPVMASDTIEAVPTGITRVDDEYWVTLTGGCPYPAGGGQLVAIDEARNQRTIVDGLNMPIDVAVGPDGTVWVLEFARFTADADCFSGKGYQTETGRLSRLRPDGTLETVIDHLNFPGAVLPMDDGSLYISEVLPGRVLHVTFDGGATSNLSEDLAPSAQTRVQPGPRTPVTDMHATLRAVVADQGLTPNPGADQQEDDTPAAQLGQLLFFDPILSGDKNISCATCHHPAFAGADGRVLPIGTGGVGLGPTRTFTDTILLADEAGTVRRLAVRNGGDAVHNPFAGQFVPRNSPTIINSALLPQQFWDGRVQSYAAAGGGTVKTKERTVNDLAMTDPLAVQALFPVASLHEMAGATFGGLAPQDIRTHLLDRLRAVPAYVDRFRDAFGTADEAPAEAVTLSRLVEALAAFERRFIYTDAPWDRYLAGDETALSDAQIQGALLFFGAVDPAINCAQCHGGDLFTDGAFRNILAPQLGPGKGNGYTGREDWGRAGVTFDARDRYAFRTPGLRNVTLTAPYLHSGAYATLEDTIRHHAAPVDAALAYDPSAFGVPPDLFSSLQPVDLARQLPTLAPELRAGLPLTDDDITALVAFLDALTDP